MVKIKDAVDIVLNYINEDISRDGLKNTADCFKETLDVFLCGYKINLDNIFIDFITNKDYNDIIFINNIEFLSICEHHLLPFKGIINIGYIPDNKIAGIGDFMKLIKAFTRRLQIQERITTQIGEYIDKFLLPKGVAINIKAEHFCMKVQDNTDAKIITNYYSGLFKTDNIVMNNFLNNIK